MKRLLLVLGVLAALLLAVPGTAHAKRADEAAAPITVDKTVDLHEDGTAYVNLVLVCDPDPVTGSTGGFVVLLLSQQTDAGQVFGSATADVVCDSTPQHVRVAVPTVPGTFDKGPATVRVRLFSEGGAVQHGDLIAPVRIKND